MDIELDEYLRLQDDGCPHTPGHVYWSSWVHQDFTMQTLTWEVPRSGGGMKLNFKVLAIRGRDLPKIGGL